MTMIKCTKSSDTLPMWINSAKIMMVYARLDAVGARVTMETGSVHDVNEDPTDVVALCGGAISLQTLAADAQAAIEAPAKSDPDLARPVLRKKQ